MCVMLVEGFLFLDSVDSSWVSPFTQGRRTAGSPGLGLQQPEEVRPRPGKQTHPDAYSESKAWVCWTLPRDTIIKKALIPAGFLHSRVNDADRSRDVH